MALAPHLKEVRKAYSELCSKAIFGNFVAPSILPILVVLCVAKSGNLVSTKLPIAKLFANFGNFKSLLFAKNGNCVSVVPSLHCHYSADLAMATLCIETSLALFFANFASFRSPIFAKNGNWCNQFLYRVFTSVSLCQF